VLSGCDRLLRSVNVHSGSRSLPASACRKNGSMAPHWWLLIRNLGIPTGGNLLKYLFPNFGYGSPAYSKVGIFTLGFDWNIWSQIWDLVLQLIPKVRIDSHRNSHWKELIEIFESVFFHSSKTGDWLNLISPHWELVENFVPIWDWELIEFNFPTLGICWNFCSHFWELIQKKNPTGGNWLTFFIPKNGKMGKWDCCKKPWPHGRRPNLVLSSLNSRCAEKNRGLKYIHYKMLDLHSPNHHWGLVKVWRP